MIAFTALFAGLVLSAFITPALALRRGLAWATNNDYANNIAHNPLIQWYHHWQDGPVSAMPSRLEYVPMFWGPRYWSQWEARLNEMRQKTPAHLMFLNEPDVSSQGNMNPYAAASLFMEQIWPWHHKGTLLGGPAIVWNLNWLGTFLYEIEKKGGSVHSICLHWYGSWNDLAGLQKYVETAHHRFNKPVWITEIGITAASHPTQSQVKNFMMDAVVWMESKPYIQRVAWFGCFTSNNPPDSFATGKNALFNSGGTLNSNGAWYSYSWNKNRRSVEARHHVLSRDDVDQQYDTPAIHCDETCQMRNAQLDEYLSSASPSA